MAIEQTAELVRPSPETHDREIAISVQGVGKMYRMYDRPQDRLKQMLLWRFGRSYGREFWALQNVSFEIEKGETVGVIGRNGSGKSTLLQIIAGTLAPTLGSVQVNGRVAALLELGSGFNPEFTGRENVFMNGAILGLSREEMMAHFDEIVAFADIGEFIDQPVKTYSSGMVVRLAFAVSVHVRPDVLIVDEALSVGDIRFQKKCTQRMEALRQQGVTILFVSHDLHLVERFCTRVIVLEQGQKLAEGEATAAAAFYQNMVLDANVPDASDNYLVETTYATGEVELLDIQLSDSAGNPSRIFKTGEDLILHARYRALQPIPCAYFGVSVWADKDTRIGQAQSVFHAALPHRLDGYQEFEVRCTLPALPLLPGTYFLRGGVYDERIHFAYCLWGWTRSVMTSFSVASDTINGFVLKPSLGYVLISSSWDVRPEGSVTP